MSKAEILKIVKVIACVIGFGVLGAAMGMLVVLIVGSGWLWDALLLSMLVFGILGAALGGYVGNRITRTKDK